MGAVEGDRSSGEDIRRIRWSYSLHAAAGGV